MADHRKDVFWPKSGKLSTKKLLPPDSVDVLYGPSCVPGSMSMGWIQSQERALE